MKKIISIFLCFVLCSECVFANSFILNTGNSEEIILPPNTRFKISMQSTIDSHSAKKNSTIAASLVEDLILDKKLIAPKGSVIYGEVTYVRQNIRTCCDGIIGFRFNEIVTPQRTIKIKSKDFIFIVEPPKEKIYYDVSEYYVDIVNYTIWGAVIQSFFLSILPLNLLFAEKDSNREILKLSLAGVILFPLGQMKNLGNGKAVVVQAGTPLTVTII